MSDDDNNIYRFGAIDGGKTEEKEFPAHPYVIFDIEGDEHFYEGYLIFTTHHVCIMEEGPDGPVTGFMIPMNRVKHVELLETVDPDQIN